MPSTSIRNCATKKRLDNFMLNQINKGNRLSHEVINLASSLLWEKKETLAALKILSWNGMSSHKEEERILGKLYLLKKRNTGYLLTGSVGVMLTFVIC